MTTPKPNIEIKTNGCKSFRTNHRRTINSMLCFPQVFAMRKHLFKAMCLGENNVTFWGRLTRGRKRKTNHFEAPFLTEKEVLASSTHYLQCVVEKAWRKYSRTIFSFDGNFVLYSKLVNHQCIKSPTYGWPVLYTYLWKVWESNPAPFFTSKVLINSLWYFPVILSAVVI